MRTPPVREVMLEAFRAGVAAVEPEGACLRRLTRSGSSVRVGQYSFEAPGGIVVIALGKAAPAMARAADKALGPVIVGALVVSDHLEAAPDGWPYLVGGHPLPDEKSLQAGRVAMDLAARTPATGLLLVLVSGGGSALVESPAPGLTLEDLARTQDSLMAAAVPIEEANTVRRHLSSIKNGGLAASAPCPVATLLVSDVIDAPAATIASGPTAPDGSRPADALSVIERSGLRYRIPPRVIAHLARDRHGPALQPHLVVVADGRSAAAGAAAAVTERGLTATVHAVPLRGIARDMAVQRLRSAPPGKIEISWGETTVEVRGPGRGGRNQEAALAAALELDGSEGAFGAFGTDGIDGPTDAAGAIVDGGTVQRGRAAGLAARHHLERNDSHPFLAATGDLIQTGPTGTNVGDLWMAWRV